jgi:hypothetical protein
MIGLRFEYNQAQFKSLENKFNRFEANMVLSQSVNDVGQYMLYRLKEYPAYRYVSRVAAYGRSFVSDKQRAWFFWALGAGIIHPGQSNRTGALGKGWQIKQTGPKQIDLVNAVLYAKFVQGTAQEQARQPSMAGWDGITIWLREFKGEIGRVAMKPIEKWIDS